MVLKEIHRMQRQCIIVSQVLVGVRLLCSRYHGFNVIRLNRVIAIFVLCIRFLSFDTSPAI